MTLNFEKGNGLIPAIIQHVDTSKVLMMGYMNPAAYQKTLDSGKITFFSRTKQRLWTKGETSGNFLFVEKVIPDCDQDTLLIKVSPSGPCCHTGSQTCFDETDAKGFLYKLERRIGERIEEQSSDSYTFALFRKGVNAMAQKVGEEAVELIIEAKDDQEELFKNESADLLYHLLILFHAKGINLQTVEEVLRKRSD